MFARGAHNLYRRELGMSEQKTRHFYVQMHMHRTPLLTKWESFMRKIQGLFYQSYDKLLIYCGKAFQSWSSQKCTLDQAYPSSCYFVYSTEGKGETTGPKTFGWINEALGVLAELKKNKKNAGMKTRWPFAKLILYLNKCSWKRMNRLIIAF